jgi:hypothetical protein
MSKRWLRYFCFGVLCVGIAALGRTASAQNRYILSNKANTNFNVDDALDVYLNGIMISSDGSLGAGIRTPINFNAKTGDTLMFVVRNGGGTCTKLDPIYISCGDFSKAVLANPGFSIGDPKAYSCGLPSGNQGASQIWHFVIPTIACTAPPAAMGPSN